MTTKREQDGQCDFCNHALDDHSHDDKENFTAPCIMCKKIGGVCNEKGTGKFR